MTVKLSEALDEARYVRTINHSELVTEMHVWHGGHTVNVYSHAQDHRDNVVLPVSSYSIGCFEDDRVSADTAQEAIDQRLDETRAEA